MINIDNKTRQLTLEQIKDKVAKGIGYGNYEGMASVTFGVANKVIRSLIDEVSKMYAQQVAEKALADAAEKTYYRDDKNSILNTEIILP